MMIDFKKHRIILEDRILHLTKTENAILELLYNNKNNIIEYEEIIMKIYNIKPDDGLKNAIRKNISILNKKIGKYIKIKNIRNVGYIIEEEI